MNKVADVFCRPSTLIETPGPPKKTRLKALQISFGPKENQQKAYYLYLQGLHLAWIKFKSDLTVTLYTMLQ